MAAVGELVANSVEHAYSDDATGAITNTGSVALHATLTSGGEVRVEASDQGRWREAPTTAGRGRGLAMGRDLVDVLRINPRAEGTTATRGGCIAAAQLRLSTP
ncbi:MAG TPA: ATP-binding protein [Pseudonocardiaceae bacterium]|nr:ATP-binding protein [Pseudonocardiaceae bacterium]